MKVKPMSVIQHITLSSLFSDIADTIRDKSGTSAPIIADDFPNAIASIPQNPIIEADITNYVIFKGKSSIIARYSVEDAQRLTILPTIPDEDDGELIGQGWNWSLDNIKAYLAKNELVSDLIIGAIYLHKDNCTRLKIEIPERGKLDIPLMLKCNIVDKLLIDWGDGTSERNTSVDAVTYNHTYAQPGKYQIKLFVDGNDAILSFGNNKAGSTLFGTYTSTTPKREIASYLKEINIGKNVTLIGTCTFYNFSALETVTFSNTVTYIKDSAFQSCCSLREIALPKNLTYLDKNAFYMCMSLYQVILPDMLETIETNAFQRCPAIQSMVIPESVKQVKNNAFSECIGLKAITIPYNENLNVHESILSACDSLIYAQIPYNYAKIEKDYFKNKQLLQKIIVTESVVSIEEQAARDCMALTDIDVKNGVKIIGSKSFYNCKSLKNISIPDSVETLSSDAFYNCSSLKTVTIPQSVNKIGSGVYTGCASILSVDFQAQVNNIPNGAFANCYSLLAINLPEGIQSINSNAFANCYSLISIKFPSTIRSLGSKAFYKCYGIYTYDFTNILAPENIPVLVNEDAIQINDGTKILVDKTLEENWKTSTTWVNFADYITSL